MLRRPYVSGILMVKFTNSELMRIETSSTHPIKDKFSGKL